MSAKRKVSFEIKTQSGVFRKLFGYRFTERSKRVVEKSFGSRRMKRVPKKIASNNFGI